MEEREVDTQGRKEMDVFKELMVREPRLLQRPVEELVPIKFIGDAAVQAFRNQLKRLARVEGMEDQRKATLEDAQNAATMMLAIDVRIGEHYASLPPAESNQGSAAAGPIRTRKEFREKTGIRRSTIQEARQMSEHQDVVAQVVATAREQGDVPSKKEVVREIRRQQAKDRPEIPKTQTQLDELAYVLELRRAIQIIRPEPPRHLTESGFVQIVAQWAVLFERGKRFREAVDAGTESHKTRTAIADGTGGKNAR